MSKVAEKSRNNCIQSQRIISKEIKRKEGIMNWKSTNNIKRFLRRKINNCIQRQRISKELHRKQGIKHNELNTRNKTDDDNWLLNAENLLPFVPFIRTDINWYFPASGIYVMRRKCSFCRISFIVFIEYLTLKGLTLHEANMHNVPRDDDHDLRPVTSFLFTHKIIECEHFAQNQINIPGNLGIWWEATVHKILTVSHLWAQKY